MTLLTTATAATASGDKYIQQLVKHWGHKFETAYDQGTGTITFGPDASLRLTSDAAAIHIALTTTDAERAERLRGVIEAHIDRFAFREAPLAYQWSA